ncbi:MAG TPA: hypothetical protein V6D47_18710 [Oscillatoriaceae cyanobacterium]
MTRFRDLGGLLLVALLIVGFCLGLLHGNPRFFYHDDFISSYLPAMTDIARGWLHGEVPILSPSSWYAGVLTGERQYGFFSPVLTLATMAWLRLGLTLPSMAAAHAMLELVILGCGTYLLARRYSLRRSLAVLVSLVTCLNGFMMAWAASNWFCLLSSFAWIPWLWWSLELAVEQPRRPWWILGGIAIALEGAAGWPFTDAMVGVVAVFVGLKAWQRGTPWKALWPIAACCALGIGLAAPSILGFLDQMHNSMRDTVAPIVERAWVTPLPALLGLVQPAFLTPWLVYNQISFKDSIELACGIAPAVALVAALVRFRREFWNAYKLELALLACALALCVMPGIGNFRWEFRWLPLFHLVLGLLGALAIAEWQQRVPRVPFEPDTWLRALTSSLGFWALVAVAVVSGRSLVMGMDPSPMTSELSGKLLLVTIAWTLVDLLSTRATRLKTWTPVLVVLGALWSTYAVLPNRIQGTPDWHYSESVRSLAPYKADVRYMGIYALNDVYRKQMEDAPSIGPLFRHANTPMYSGVQFVNGYSSMGPRSLDKAFGFQINFGTVSPALAKLVLDHGAGPGGWLARQGVDGLMIGATYLPLAQHLQALGWHQTFQSSEGALFERNGAASPRVWALSDALTEPDEDSACQALGQNPTIAILQLPGQDATRRVRFAPRQVTLNAETRTRTDATVSPGPGTSLVVFSRPYYPGFHATLDGHPLAIARVDVDLPAVLIPPGVGGHLALWYWPRALSLGLPVALGSLLLALLGAIAAWRWVPKRREESAIAA